MRILIADDESIIRLGIKAMLTELGHEVVMANNGRQALDMARTKDPELAIFDIKMPYTDGLEAAKVIARTNPIPIILLTAYSEDDLIDKATDLPIHGYLIKPIKPADLSAAIRVAQKRFAENQALQEKNLELEEKLKERKLIAKAKGKLMNAGLDEEEAYRFLQKHARDHRMSLPDAAVAVIRWAKP